MAMNNMDCCYERGNGVLKDDKKAIELFQKAVDLGNAFAVRNLRSYRERGF